MPERGFFIFFLLFFSEFSSPGRVWTETGTKFFFSLFFSLSTPILALKNFRKRFFNFLIFFFYFFGNYFPGLSMNWIWGENFFVSFSAYLISFWLKRMPERGFLISWFFYYFFRNFLARVEYELNLGQIFFFFFAFPGLSHPVLAKNNAGKRFFNFLNFFRNFLPQAEYEWKSG